MSMHVANEDSALVLPAYSVLHVVFLFVLGVGPALGVIGDFLSDHARSGRCHYLDDRKAVLIEEQSGRQSFDRERALHFAQS